MKRLFAACLAALAVTGCAVSTQQEVQMGQQYAQQINQQLPIIQDPEIQRYIQTLGDSIARLTSRGDTLDWHFYVVDSPEVNAFAIPGGFIYVNRGVIERAAKMDELAGVLGHEIGHVVRRHSIKQMQQQQGAQLGVGIGCILLRVCGAPGAGDVVNVGAGALFAHFSRDDEAQADAEGVKNVIRAGIDPHGLPDMFRILLAERQSKPGAVDAWFATHPMEEDRIAATERMIDGYDPAVLRGLTRDTRNFHTFKDRVHALPPSPPQRSGG